MLVACPVLFFKSDMMYWVKWIEVVKPLEQTFMFILLGVGLCLVFGRAVLSEAKITSVSLFFSPLLSLDFPRAPLHKVWDLQFYYMQSSALQDPNWRGGKVYVRGGSHSVITQWGLSLLVSLSWIFSFPHVKGWRVLEPDISVYSSWMLEWAGVGYFYSPRLGREGFGKITDRL